MSEDSADQVFEELQDIVQQAILREFPNPERKGCPGDAVLRELAHRQRPIRDAAWEHITHCSPCYRQFLDLRSQVRDDQKRRRRATHLRWAIAGAVVLAVVAITAYEVAHHHRTGQNYGPLQSASLDFRDRSVARNAERRPAKTEPLVLPAGRLNLTIFLPIGSEPGRYEVQLLKTINKPLLNTVGEAHVESGTTILNARLDLAAQAPGSFLIGLRQPPSDWTYYPVTIQ